MFDVCTMGDTAHIDTIFKLLPHTREHVSKKSKDGTALYRTSLVKKNSLPVAVNNSIKVSPLVFLL